MNAQNLSSLLMGVSLVGTGVQTYGQIAGSRAEAEAYEYNAKQARIEAGLKEKQVRKRYATLMGEQRAAYAEAGVDITEGSPLLILAAQAAEAEEEAQMVRYGGRAEADKLRYMGKQTKRAGLMGATSTFVTGLGQTAIDYATRKKII